MGLNFVEHQDVVFDRPPLVTVLCQIKFPPVLSLMTTAGVAGFQAGLREQYDTMLPVERQAKLDVGAGNVGIETIPPVFRFRDTTENWRVGVSAEFVSLETFAYTGIDAFLERLQRILKVLRLTVRPADSVRVGLRKINLIALPDEAQTTSLLGIVRRELLGPLAVEEFPAPLSACQGHLEYTDGSNVLAVRYGMGSAGEKGSGFILDLDHYTNRPYRLDDNDDLIGLMKYLSDGITSFFHWSIEDGYRLSLGPRPRGVTL